MQPSTAGLAPLPTVASVVVPGGSTTSDDLLGEDRMMHNWKRAGLGVCTATAVALTAGLAMAPAAHAATTPTGGLLGGLTGTVNGVVGGVTGTVNGVTGTVSGVTGTTTGTTGGLSGVTGAVNGVTGTVNGLTGGSSTTGLSGVTGTVTGLLNGLLTGTATSNGSPVAVSTTNGSISVGLGGTTIGVNAGGGTVGAGVTGTPVKATVPTGATTTTPTTTTTTTDPVTGQVTTTTVPVTPAVSALRITSSVDTVYPAKDGYRDTVVLHVTGTTASGAAQPVAGVVVVKRGATEVKRWTIGSSTADLTWDGRSGGKIVAGAYTVTGVAVDATGTAVAAMDTLAVSAKKLVTTTQKVTSKSVSGTHVMAAKAKAGLAKGKVLLRVTTTATGVVGKQYLVFTHKGKHLKVPIQNGTHTSKAITVPKSFTTYKLSHTWKASTVSLKSVVYKYTYKKLK